MSPRPRRRSDARRPTRTADGRPAPRRPTVARLPVLVVALAVGGLLVACGAKFDPTGSCTADGSAPGAYPVLEVAVPRDFRGPPRDLDSGRACTAAGLGPLAGHGVTEIQFAGGTWTSGSDSGTSLAVFVAPTGPALTRDWMTEFYEAGAKAGKNVTSVETSDFVISPTITGRRIDVLNGESYQSVVVWDHDGLIAVALVANFIREIQTKAAHDGVVQQAVDAFGDSGSLIGG